ncbi:MAG: dynamin family protein, partial [Cetobacterium sp.]|uniref:helix-turn-helix domain-containing protein n=1 Tax=Cetobacterium sp. TaxID=2071632 RepID=UPI003F3BF023
MNYKNLIWLREHRLKKTQKELAISLNTTQDMISKIENGQSTPSIDFLKSYSFLVGGTFSDFLEFIDLDTKKNNYNNIEINLAQCKYDIRKEKNNIDTYFNSLFTLIKTDYLKEKILNNYNIIEKINSELSIKPKLVFLGLSDSGKSSAINYFLGNSLLKAEWTPTTSSLVLIKHVSDKPATLDINDNVLIFTHKHNNSNKWNEEDALIKEKLIKNREKSTPTKKYLKGDENFDIEAGDFTLLNRCNRSNGTISENIAMAVVYIQSDLLELCDIIDTPGLTGEFSSIKDNLTTKEKVLIDVEKDNKMIEDALKMGNIFIFMNQINKFNDSNVNKLIINSLKNNNSKSVYNFLLASQADIVGNNFQIEKITGLAKEKLLKDYKDIDKLDTIIQHFYPFSTINTSLNEEFINQLKEILITTIPQEQYNILLNNKNIFLDIFKNILDDEQIS